MDTKLEEKVGGKAEFGFDKRGMVFRMDVVKLEPDKRVVFKCHGDHPEWNGTTLTWEIEKGDDANILRFYSQRLGVDHGFLRKLQFRLGRADASAQRRCGRKEAWATLDGVSLA